MKQTAEKLIQVKYKEAPFGTIGVMCVLSLACIAILIRNDILRDGSDNMAQIAYIFCLVFLTGILLWISNAMAEVPRELLYILFWFLGENLCDYIFLSGYDLRKERRLSGRLASVKVFFSEQ